jgi:hypothetical protein
MRTLVRTAALIESWFDLLPEANRATARQIQSAVLAARPQLAQAIKWGNLVFMHEGTNAMAIVSHRSHVNLQVFSGHLLALQYPQLEGTGKGVRHLKLRCGQPVDAALVGALARACVEELDASR